MFIVMIISSILLISIDQILKFVVTSNLKTDGLLTVIDNVLSFTYVENRGAAFGVLQNSRWFFIVLTSVALVAIIWYYISHKPTNKLLNLSIILVFSGAVGNFIDRLFLGYVIDYIWFTFVNFAVFNFADMCLSVGTVLLVVYIIFFDKKEDKNGQCIEDNSQNEQ